MVHSFTLIQQWFHKFHDNGTMHSQANMCSVSGPFSCQALHSLNKNTEKFFRILVCHFLPYSRVHTKIITAK
jgi:hypothetical protein